MPGAGRTSCTTKICSSVWLYFSEDTYSIDVTTFHKYAVCWTPGKVALYIDDTIVREINQSPDYTMQLMLGIYELPEQLTDASSQRYPKEFVVDYVRGYAIKE